MHRIERGDSWWIAIGVVLELLSFAGYVVLFRAVFVRGHGRIGWPESYEITMAGLAATRLFAAAGAGGIALTAWALRRSGMEPRLVACRMVAFMVLLYVVYAGSLLIDGIGLGTGLFPGGGSFAITYRAGDRRGAAARRRRRGRCAARRRRAAPAAAGRRAPGAWRTGSPALSTVPALAASGVRTAIELIRSRDAGRARARWPGGALTSACCGRCSTPSARRRRSR